mgnify:FL=1|tara:strand:+ start:37905 stop:40154 length:2250 start_codon:yes stop_codon:yes gene_type:complete
MITVVIKRDGTSVPFDVNKLNKWGEWAANNQVSWSDVVFKAMRKLTEGCSTEDIIKALIDACLDNNSYEHSKMAARLLVGDIYKEVFGSFIEVPPLLDFYDNMVTESKWKDMGYTPEELIYLEDVIDHSKDFNYEFSTVKQVSERYALKDVKTGNLFESLQFTYMGVALAACSIQPLERRLKDVCNMYEALSDLKINAPTPTLSQLRTDNNGLASCCLFTNKDTSASIEVATHIAYTMTCANSGIGGYLNTRSLGDGVRNNTIEHTGKLPYYRYLEAAVKSTKQSSRGGAATIYFTCLDPEMEDLTRLKHPTTPVAKQIRGMDYGVMMNKYFMEKVAKNEDWMLISIHNAPELFKLFFSEDIEGFKAEYNRVYDSGISKKVVNARELALSIEKQYYETGRVYSLMIDEANRHTPFKDPIFSSNLCNEIMLPTKGYDDVSQLYGTDIDAGEVALCFIAAIAVGRVTPEEYEKIAYYAAMLVDNTMELTSYPFNQVKLTAQARRSMGIGITNLADAMAVKGVSYSSQEGKQYIHDLAEMHSFYLHKASLRLAKEKGNAEWIHKTKYPDGWLPIDTYNKNVDNVVSGLKMDWEGLRKEIIKQGGIRNSVLEATMPAETSSQASNTTNSVYPIRDLVITKASGKSKIPCYVPHYGNLMSRIKYERAYDVPYNDIVDMYAIVQKFHGQSISADFYFDPSKYPNRKIGAKEQLQRLLYMAKMGMKSRYYMNTKTESGKEIEDLPSEVCSSGGCTL